MTILQNLAEYPQLPAIYLRQLSETRTHDCATLSRMSLPELLYYILVGDGRRLAAD